MGAHFTIDEASFDALVARKTGLPLQEGQYLPFLEGLVRSKVVPCHIQDADAVSIYEIVLGSDGKLKKVRV